MKQEYPPPCAAALIPGCVVCLGILTTAGSPNMRPIIPIYVTTPPTDLPHPVTSAPASSTTRPAGPRPSPPPSLPPLPLASEIHIVQRPPLLSSLINPDSQIHWSNSLSNRPSRNRQVLPENGTSFAHFPCPPRPLRRLKAALNGFDPRHTLRQPPRAPGAPGLQIRSPPPDRILLQ